MGVVFIKFFIPTKVSALDMKLEFIYLMFKVQFLAL